MLKVNNDRPTLEYMNCGAGTGKTYRMKQRVIELLKQNPKAKIFCSTFTNLAKNNMENHIKAALNVEEIPSNVIVTTLHKFCWDILNNSGEQLEIASARLLQSTRVMRVRATDPYINIFMYSILFKQWLEFKQEKFFKVLQEKPVTFKQYQKYLTIYREDECKLILNRAIKNIREFNIPENKINYFKNNKINTSIKLIQEEFHWRSTQGLISMEDLVIFAICSLNSWSTKYDYVFIDEFQDLNLFDIFFYLNCLDSKNYFVMGDTNQSLYSWRGANPEETLKYLQDVTDLQQIIMNKNYRSANKIVECANMLSGRNDISMRSDLTASLSLFLTSCTTTQEKQIALKYLNTYIHSIPDDKTVAFLCETNAEVFEVSSILNSMGIQPFNKMRDVTQDLPLINGALSLLDIGLNPHNISKVYNLFSDESLLTLCKIDVNNYLDYLKQKICKDFILDPVDNIVSRIANSINTKDIVVFDFETNSLDTLKAEIVQIGAIKLNSDLEEIGRFNQLIKINGVVGESEKTHHFSDKLLQESGKDEELVFKQFLDFIDGCVLFAHNASYDHEVLRYTAQRLYGKDLTELVSITVHDTLDWIKFIHPNLLTYKLGNLNETLHLGCTPNHNAMDDVIATAALLKYIVKQYPQRLYDLKVWQETNAQSNQITYMLRKFIEKKPLYSYTNFLDNYHFYKDLNSEFDWGEQLPYLGAIEAQILNRIDTLINDGYTPFKIKEEFYLNKILKDITSKYSVMTVHQAKGLEFDSVIYFIPSTKGNKFNQQLCEDYVAFTRAKSEFIGIHNSNNSPRVLVQSLEKLVEPIPIKI